jgi:aldehyde dehydrogenase (NAD(P)+)
MSIDSIEHVASKQAEWKALSVHSKMELLQEIKSNLSALNMEDMMQLLGIPEATMMGFVPNSTDEAHMEACQAGFMYAFVVGGVIGKLIAAYQCAAGVTQKHKQPKLISARNSSGRVTVQTIPVLAEDKYGLLAKSSAEVWLKEGSDFAKGAFDLDSFQNDATGCRVVLAAGNQSFLSAVDCLQGLFYCNQTVFLKHHPVRNYHDVILRKIMKPLIDRGYFDTELDTGNMQRSQAIVSHPAVTHVHLTGGKATHDAIVWGTHQRDVPVLKANMTSELGCVTPWIVAPQVWTDVQMDHQVKQLYAALYSNAGANCNCPKVVILTKAWPQAAEFVRKLCAEMKNNPPNIYYRLKDVELSGLSDVEIDDSIRLPVSAARVAVVLPWLLMDGAQVDLTTEKGRQAAAKEYAFRNEPFAPIVTIAYTEDLPTSVQLANNHLFGSLSCTVVAPETTPEVEQAIADLKYGTVAVNVWCAIGYLATGCTWGAFPGDRLEAVESGIGQIQNCFFIPGVEKSVLRTPMVDAAHPMRKGNVAAAKEFTAIGNFALQPGVATFANLMAVSILGVELPKPSTSTLAGIAIVAVGAATHKLWMP